MLKKLILVTCIIILLIGCNPDKRGMMGRNDVLMLYTSIDDNSEIITVEIRNNGLHLEIKPEKQTELVERKIRFKRGNLHNYEYHTMSRLRGVALFHFVRKPFDPENLNQKNVKLPHIYRNSSIQFNRYSIL